METPVNYAGTCPIAPIIRALTWNHARGLGLLNEALRWSSILTDHLPTPKKKLGVCHDSVTAIADPAPSWRGVRNGDWMSPCAKLRIS
jgi:hypothetical protein